MFHSLNTQPVLDVLFLTNMKLREKDAELSRSDFSHAELCLILSKIILKLRQNVTIIL